MILIYSMWTRDCSIEQGCYCMNATGKPCRYNDASTGKTRISLWSCSKSIRTLRSCLTSWWNICVCLIVSRGQGSMVLGIWSMWSMWYTTTLRFVTDSIANIHCLLFDLFWVLWSTKCGKLGWVITMKKFHAIQALNTLLISAAYRLFFIYTKRKVKAVCDLYTEVNVHGWNHIS